MLRRASGQLWRKTSAWQTHARSELYPLPSGQWAIWRCEAFRAFASRPAAPGRILRLRCRYGRFNQEDIWALRAALAASLGGVLLGCWMYCKHLGNVNDKVWIGPRGLVSKERAYTVGPIMACTGSALVATLLVWRFPVAAKSCSIPKTPFELLGMPLAIVLAFRFQNSYERWWSSRKDIEDVAAKIQAFALIANTKCHKHYSDLQHAHGKDHEMRLRELQDRIFGLLDYLCFIVEYDLTAGQDPHPDNEPATWEDATRWLSEQDARESLNAPDRFVWGSGCLMDCIHTGQLLGCFSNELAGMMFTITTDLVAVFHNSIVPTTQASPAPFVIHMRTFLLGYCFWIPFSMIHALSWRAMLPVSLSVGYGFLGIEFCAREMEQPYGNDASDIPVRLIMSGTRQVIEHLRRPA